MSAQVSRRAVLEAVGAVGGAGILFESMGALGLAPTAGAAQAPYRAPTPGDFSLTGRRRARVVVLGAGIAGLTAAYELGKAGYDCVVLEASSRPGGRNWTVRGGTTERDLDGHVQTARFGKGQYLNAGPARIAQWMVTMDYCRELGVAIEPLANQNASSYIYHEKGPLSGTGIRYRTAKADVYGYISELLAKATDQGALDRTLTAADKERLLDLLRDFGDINGRSGGWRYEGSEPPGVPRESRRRKPEGRRARAAAVAARRPGQRDRPRLLLRVRLRAGDDDVPAGRRDGPHRLRPGGEGGCRAAEIPLAGALARRPP